VVAPTKVSRNVLGYTWAKHVYGALLVATAVVDAHVYEVVERSLAVQRMLAALVVENMTVADAASIRSRAASASPTRFASTSSEAPTARAHASAS